MMTRTAQLENGVFLLVFIVCLFPFGETDAALTLTSQPPSSGPYCPGSVNFTCVGTEITSTLFWLVNGYRVAVYGYSSRDDLPMDLDIEPPLDGVTARITEVDRITNTLFNITSIFSVSDVTVLNGSSLQCEDSNNGSNNLIISLRLVDIPSPANHLLHLLGSSKVSLLWSPSFTSQYAVERYRVSVNPDPSSCSSDQVSPSEDYSCSGLVLGTSYTFTVSAINCGDQEGEMESFTVKITTKALGSPTNVAVTREDNQLVVKWQEVVFPLDTDKTFNNATNYSVVIRDIEGNELYRTEVNSNACDDDRLCTVRNIPADFPLERITVSVTASNVFGESENSVTCVRLTNINTVLLSLGVFFSAIASLGCVILIVLIVKKGYSTSVLILVIMGCIVLVISILVLWMAVAFQVGLQDNTCDSDWQFSRGGLITSAFVLSATALIVIVATILVAAWASKKERKDKYEPEAGKPTDQMMIPLEDTSQNDKEDENQAEQKQHEALKVYKFGAIKPAWQPDDLHECQDCGAKLYRGRPGFGHHHCYACGKLVCGACSAKKAYLEYCKEECRVCKNCFKEYSEQPGQVKDSPVPEKSVEETSLDADPHVPNPQNQRAAGSQGEDQEHSTSSEGDQNSRYVQMADEHHQNPQQEGSQQLESTNRESTSTDDANLLSTEGHGQTHSVQPQVTLQQETSTAQREPQEPKSKKEDVKELVDSKSDSDFPPDKSTSEKPEIGGNPPRQATSNKQEVRATETKNLKTKVVGSGSDTEVDQQGRVTQRSPSPEAAVPTVKEQPTEVKRNVLGVLRTDSQWEPDDSRTICPVCNKTEFARRLSKERRYHHCRVCGRVVCQACSSQEVFLKNYKGKERVCDECWKDTSLGLQRREQIREEGPQVKETGSQGQVKGPKAEEKIQQVSEKVQHVQVQEKVKEVNKSDPQMSKRGPQDQDNNPQDPQEIPPFCPKEPFFVELTSDCLSCKTDFSLPKRHQCPGCGNWVCSKCSKNEALIKYSSKEERVCDVCHGKYLENVVFDEKPYFVPIVRDGAAKCLLCKKVFKPPKHVQCRACGNWYCGKCSKKQVPLQYSGKTERVCDFCYAKYQAMIEVSTTKTEVAGSASRSPQVPPVDPTTENTPDSEVERGPNNKN